MKAVKFLLVVATLAVSAFAHSDVLPCQKAAAAARDKNPKASLTANAPAAVVAKPRVATGADGSQQTP